MKNKFENNNFKIKEDVISEELNIEYCELFMKKLGIDIDSYTDPKLLIEILKDDMQLYDMPEIKELFGNKLFENESLKPFLEEIINAIKNKHPAIIEFLTQVVENNLIDNLDINTKIIIKILHHTYILDLITKNMNNNIDLTENIAQYLMNKKKEFYLANNYLGAILGIYKLTGSIFSTVKAMSVDRAIKKSMYLRKSNKNLPHSQLIKLRAVLVLNILEATIADFCNGFKNNAFCGLALALSPPKSYYIEENNSAIKVDVNQDWCSLYETWNLAFVSGNLSNLNFTYPTLLIPSVINAEPLNYLSNRTYSLFLTVNFRLFAQSSNKVFEITQNKKIAKIWGDINAKYRREFIEKNNLKSIKNIIYSFFK